MASAMTPNLLRSVFVGTLLLMASIQARRHCLKSGEDLISNEEIQAHCDASPSDQAHVVPYPSEGFGQSELRGAVADANAVIHSKIRRIHEKNVSRIDCVQDPESGECSFEKTCNLTSRHFFLELENLCLLAGPSNKFLSQQEDSQCETVSHYVTFQSDCAIGDVSMEGSYVILVDASSSRSSPNGNNSSCRIISGVSITHLIPVTEELLVDVMSVCGLQRPVLPDKSNGIDIRESSCPTLTDMSCTNGASSVLCRGILWSVLLSSLAYFLHNSVAD